MNLCFVVYKNHLFPISCFFLLSFFLQSTLSAAPNLQTDKNNYQPGETIKVHFNDAPGNSRDWVCITLSSIPDTTAGEYQYLPSKARQGSLTFTAPAAGHYEVRAYYDYSKLGYVVSARHAFSVGSVSSPAKAVQGSQTAQPANNTNNTEDGGLGVGYFMSELSGSAKPVGGISEAIPVTKKYNASKSHLWNAVQDVLDDQGYFFSADSSSGRIKTDPRMLGDQSNVTMFGATYAAIVSIKVRGGNVSFRARFNKQSNVVMGGSLLEYPDKENALRQEFFTALDAMLNN